MNCEKLKQKGEEILEIAKGYMEANSWVTRGTFDDVLMESMDIPEKSSVPCYRFTTYSTKSIDELVMCPWRLTEEILKRDDDSVQKWSIIEENKKSNCRIIQMINKMPWPCWAREIVIAQSIVREQNANWLVSWSVSHENVPEKPHEMV